MLNQFSKTWTLLKRIKKCLKNSRKMRSSTTCKIRCRNLEMQVQTTYESTPSSWVSSGSVSKWRFSVEWKWNLSKSGHPVHSIGDCVPLAHPKWKTEPEAVRKKYEAKAKAHKEVRFESEFLFSVHKSKPLKPPKSHFTYDLSRRCDARNRKGDWTTPENRFRSIEIRTKSWIRTGRWLVWT